MGDVVDSPAGWVGRHVQRYVATDGADGHLFHGNPTLLLTTLGRRSGTRRRTPLIYGRAGDSYVIVGSNGGSGSHPAWYLNLTAEPAVTVQVLADVFEATARTAGGAERDELWAMMVGVFPTYAQYRRGTAREIPVVVLDRSTPA